MTDSTLPAQGAMGRYHQVLRRRMLMIAVLVLAIIASLVLDFTLGPAGLSLPTLWQSLLHPATVDAGTRVIVWDIRLPYALMAVVVGFCLGLAGAEASLRRRRSARRWRLFSASAFPACRISG